MPSLEINIRNQKTAFHAAERCKRKAFSPVALHQEADSACKRRNFSRVWKRR